jgi:predicted nucleotidyltransferase
MRSYNDWIKEAPEARALLRKVEAEVHSVVPDAEIILYGSQARGHSDLTSDWDFLILVDGPLDGILIKSLKDRLYDLELETDTVLSSIIRSREEWDSPRYSVLPFKRVVDEEGVLL